MAVTLTIDRPLAARVDPRLSPLTELACALHSALEPDHHPRSSRWAEAFRNAEAGRFADEAGRWAPLLGAFKARYFFPLAADFVSDIHSEIEAIAQLSRGDFAAMTAQALVGQNAYLLAGDDALRASEAADLIRRMARYSDAHVRLARDLAHDPEDVQRRLASFLHAIAVGPFGGEWERISGFLERERTRTAMVLRSDPWAAFERLALVRVDRDEAVVVFEKLYNAHIRLSEAHVVLLPSMHSAPHSPVKHYPGLPVVVCMPTAPDGTELPDGLEAVMARLAALNEPNRLKMCRDLLRMPASTTELAQRFRMTPQQVSRHLRRLREVGLIIGVRHGAEVRYRLDASTLRRLGTDVLSVLQV